VEQLDYNLFHRTKENTAVPLAERCRPKNLNEIVGHQRYLGKNSGLRKQIDAGHLPSLIFWGPPGVGKTTLAQAIAIELDLPFTRISAVTSGVKDLKEIIKRARYELDKRHILFIDEIHRYNKAQQDGLLHAVEDGTLILMGATTENPSFEIISPLLSRCQVIKLDPLSVDDLKKIVRRAVSSDALLKKYTIKISAIDKLLLYGAGDARRTLNILENCVSIGKTEGDHIEINAALIDKSIQQQTLQYDKSGDYHYDNISAFIKSIRGSDPDAAVYYLARMLAAGEDVVFIARRLIILASEDIGNAEPYALSLATAGLQAVHAIGMPEAKIVLSQVTTYLASCPKSNAAYNAISNAEDDLKTHPILPVPLHLRNAPTSLMRDLDYASGYKYPHDFPQHFVTEKYRPDEIQDNIYYHPTSLGREKNVLERLIQLWPSRYKNKKQKEK
jgi:putative ATPase